jgi:hypothetical protein
MTNIKATVQTTPGSMTYAFRVETPSYDPKFVALARSLKGKWDPQARAWYFGFVCAKLYLGLVGLYGEDGVAWGPEGKTVSEQTTIPWPQA